MDHSSALGYSPRLPVSVYGTGSLGNVRRFSRQHAWGHYGFAYDSPYCRVSALMSGGFAYHSA